MRRLLPFVILVSLFVIPPASRCDEIPLGVLCTSKEMRMSFSLPVKPTTSTQTATTKAGKIVFHMFLLDNGTSSVLVSAADYPKALLKPDPQATLHDAVTGAAGADAKILSEKQITLGNVPGVEAEYAGPELHGKCRMYLDGVRLYQIVSSASPDTPLAPFTDKFFDSFRILAK